tara:strand:- start:1330 stop:1887 length:558 start_codon:yes stop_codon:yes gene_type:complete
MSEENKTAQSEENAVNNTSTEAVEKNVEQSVPLSRFSEINSKYKSANEQLEKYKLEEAKRTEAEKVAKGEFDAVLAEKDKIIQEQAPIVAHWKDYTTKRRANLIEKLPEEKKVFGEQMKDLDMLEQYVETEVQSAPVNAGKTNSQRQGVNKVGEFGGFNSTQEFAQKDPVGFQKYLEKNVPGYIK